MKSAYLVMVSQDNHNKVYRMNEEEGGVFVATYGRIGAAVQKRKYPMRQWDTKYAEKIRKGYTDVTSYHKEDHGSDERGYLPIANEAVSNLVEKLLSAAKQSIKRNYRVTWKDVTQEMIMSANHILQRLSRLNDVNSFNEELIKLFTILPRKMVSVDAFLAKKERDISDILERETDLLNTMSAQVKLSQNKTETITSKQQTILEASGMEIRLCTEQELENIRKYLTAESAGKLKNAYYVKNLQTETKFNDYCKAHDIKRGNVHFLYHGSRNENWWSILSAGLNLNPKAVITGKMFGYGLYFANRAKKSINYTSLGGFYTGEKEKNGYLAVYKVAYKNPLDVYSWKADYTSYRKGSLKEYDAVYAHKGSMLLNDEIVVYDDAQTTIRYIIELEQG